MLNDLNGIDDKIYSLDDDLIEPEFEISSTAEQSPNPPELQVAWVSAVARELESIAEFDPRPPASFAPESCCQYKKSHSRVQGQSFCCAAIPSPMLEVVLSKIWPT